MTAARRMSVLAEAISVHFHELQQVVNELSADRGVAWTLIPEDDTPLLETVSGIYRDQALIDAAIVEVTQRLGGAA